MAAQSIESNQSMDDWLTPEEAAKILKVSKDTIIRQCEKHHLPAVKLGSIWRISFHGLQVQAEKNVAGKSLSVVEEGSSSVH